MTRKLFGTDGIRGEFGKEPLDLGTMRKLGKTAGRFFKGKCLIGRDTRESGELIEKELVEGLVSQGVDVYLLGIISTPGVSWLVKELGMDFGIMITASHNPYQDNGIKFFNKEGFKLSDGVEGEIEDVFFESDFGKGVKGSENREREKGVVLEDEKGDVYQIESKKKKYVEFLKGLIPDLKGMKIVLDCANGAGYEIAPLVFEELGADIVVVNNQPDGKNINEQCGAMHPGLLKEKVVESGADVGITLDGDADRVIMLDEKGEVVDGDYLMAIMALKMMEKKELGEDTLVVTKYSNLGLVKAIEEAGGKVGMVENGDRYVLEEMKRLGSNLGGEQSGHFIFLDHNQTGDGVVSGLQILKIMKERGKKLSELCLVMEKFPQVLVNVEVEEKKELAEMAGVMRKIKEVEEKLGSEGRVFVRYSGTQNLLRVMVEGKDEKEIGNYAQKIVMEVRKEIGVEKMNELNYYFEDMGACPCLGAFERVEGPWEALGKIDPYFDFTENLVGGEVHESAVISGKVKIGKGTKIGPYVVIEGPVVIGENCVVRPFALLRPGTILGDGCVVGNGSEVKKAIVFSGAKIASQAFVGDSILGKGARIGSGTILANRRFDQGDIYVSVEGKKVYSGSDKFGAVVGEYVRLGANCVVLPGTLVGKYTWTYPNSCVGGFLEKDKFVKSKRVFEIVDKERKKLSAVDKEGKV